MMMKLIDMLDFFQKVRSRTRSESSEDSKVEAKPKSSEREIKEVKITHCAKLQID